MKKIFFFLALAGILNAQSINKDFKAKFNASAITYENVVQNPQILPTEKQFEKKSKGKAILYSLLLPGMGERYAGGDKIGEYFTIGDAILWGVFAGLEIYGNWEENNYKEFAKAYAGVNLDGKDDRYFANVGNYISVFQYNREQELNRQFNKVYDENKYYWLWTSQSQRREYRGMWKASENAYNAVQFVVGALILNRIASAINAVRVVNNYNKKIESKNNVSFRFGVERINPVVSNLSFQVRVKF